MKISPYAVFLVGLIFTAAACAAGTDEPTTPGDSGKVPATGSTLQVVGTTEPSSTEPGVVPPLDSVGAVRSYLAASEGVSLESVELLLQEEVTWPNGALGCPEAGMSYTQALVDGFRLVFAVEGTEYAFHSGQDGSYFYCENPGQPIAGTPDA